MLAQTNPYTPSLYRPDAYGRYRQYPRNVVAPIPGVGYDVGTLVWAEQELNLDGSATPQHYGDYASVPLRGLGVEAPGIFSADTSATERLAFYDRLPERLKSQIPKATVDSLRAQAAAEYGEPWPAHEYPDMPTESGREKRAEEAAARAEATLPSTEEGFFDKKLGPVPLWAVIGGGVLAVGGGAWWWMRRKR